MSCVQKNSVTVTTHSMNMTEMIHMMRSRHNETVTTTKNSSNSGCNRMIIEAGMVKSILTAMQLIIIMILAGGCHDPCKQL